MNGIDKLILGYLDRADAICEESNGVQNHSEEIVRVAKMLQLEEHWQTEQARIVAQEVDSMTVEELKQAVKNASGINPIMEGNVPVFSGNFKPYDIQNENGIISFKPMEVVNE